MPFPFWRWHTIGSWQHLLFQPVANVGHLAANFWDQIWNQRSLIYTTIMQTVANRALFGCLKRISSCYSFSLILMQFLIAKKLQFYFIDPQSISNWRKIHGFAHFDKNKHPRMSIEALWQLIFPPLSLQICASDVPNNCLFYYILFLNLKSQSNASFSIRN